LSRRHGRNGRIYFALASNGTAAPLNFQAKWSLSAATDTDEVTALGDSNKIYVSGLPDASGDFSGFWDDATAQTYTAAVDGVARPFYLYPDNTNQPAKYWFGTIIADFKVDGDVSGAVKVAASWKAATPIISVGLG
jgi:hypothetical protein